MGANAVNTACEKLAPLIESITGGKVHLRILSNLADQRLARARVTIPVNELTIGFELYKGETVRDGIIAAWAFAACDLVATHNKGLDGVDKWLLATIGVPLKPVLMPTPALADIPLSTGHDASGARHA
jgi:hydroxymethylglutaryl-CoA reductase